MDPDRCFGVGWRAFDPSNPERRVLGFAVIALAFVTGGATLVVAVALRRFWLAALPRSVCPTCGEATASVSHPLLALTERWLRRRWCAACGWEGWGRNGPVLWRHRGPISHESGFRWGPHRLASDFGFRWAAQPVTTTQSDAPAHPSGFRWGGVDQEPALTSAHPSGFRWGARDEEPAVTSPHPSGFRWAAIDAATDAEPAIAAAHPSGFRWGTMERQQRRPSRPVAPFRWKV
jgi:hypothetical protein